MFLILIALAIISLIYLLVIRPYNYWKEKGVEQGNPIPIFGHSFAMIMRRESYIEFTQKIYNIGKNKRYWGIYQFTTPSLVLCDLELIKQITVKDFDYFLDHRSLLPEDTNPLWTRNLFALKGQKWRDMRSTLSPAFTSSKMKMMFDLMRQNAEIFVQFFLDQDKEAICIEIKDTFTRYTNDVIANTAFGVEVNSLKEPNNEFYLMGKETTDFSGLKKALKFFGYLFAPRLLALFNVQMFSQKVADFFRNLVSSNIKVREENNITRPDLINLLIQCKNGCLKYEEDGIKDTSYASIEESDDIAKYGEIKENQLVTDDDLTAQALLFFFTGFESVSAFMCFMAYELALNPDVQAKLAREIDQTCNNNTKVTYNMILSMKYLDMVVSETLRKWPLGIAAERVCTKPYIMEPKYENERQLKLEPGDGVVIPIFGIHRDEKYYPDPERFDPERFSDENRHKIQPYSYLPFGAGPRHCIGCRFALLETKVLFYYILRSFEIVPNSKTQIPLVIARNTFNVTCEKGFWFDLKRRVEK